MTRRDARALRTVGRPGAPEFSLRASSHSLPAIIAKSPSAADYHRPPLRMTQVAHNESIRAVAKAKRSAEEAREEQMLRAGEAQAAERLNQQLATLSGQR